MNKEIFDRLEASGSIIDERYFKNQDPDLWFIIKKEKYDLIKQEFLRTNQDA